MTYFCSGLLSLLFISALAKLCMLNSVGLLGSLLSLDLTSRIDRNRILCKIELCRNTNVTPFYAMMRTSPLYEMSYFSRITLVNCLRLCQGGLEAYISTLRFSLIHKNTFIVCTDSNSV